MADYKKKEMKIGFDVSDLTTGRADGTTRYTYELAKRLPGLDSRHEWTYYAPGNIAGRYEINDVKYEMRISKWPKYWTQMRLPWDLYRFKPDVLFMPIQQIPYLRPSKMKTVAVVHDLAVHKYPEQFTYKDWALLHTFSAYVARQADEVIAVSKATADDIEKYYGRTEDVSVVYHGVDHQRFRKPRDDEEKKAAWRKIKEQLPGIGQPYVLYVGQIQPRKNLIRLIDAFDQIGAKDRDVQLVVAGGHGWLKKEILERAEKARCKERIHMVGTVSDELLSGLYWNADSFVLPSLYEGFGMPILEAMACGCPVVTSSVSSMPEVAGGAAILVDPGDVESIAEGIDKARADREKLRELGIKRASQFDWEKAAKETMQVLEL
jgi:glycosyltransferase involved in cell wall biosynthesis